MIGMGFQKLCAWSTVAVAANKLKLDHRAALLPVLTVVAVWFKKTGPLNPPGNTGMRPDPVPDEAPI